MSGLPNTMRRVRRPPHLHSYPCPRCYGNAQQSGVHEPTVYVEFMCPSGHRFLALWADVQKHTRWLGNGSHSRTGLGKMRQGEQ